MAVATETRSIGGYRYRVTQLTALRSRALFVRLLKSFGPTLAALLGTGASQRLLDLDTSALAPMLTELCERLSDEELDYFCETLGSCTELVNEAGDGARLNKGLIDVHFAGRLLDMFKWLAFALEVNYADFLSALKTTQAAKSAPLASPPLPSPPGSIGITGAS